LTPTTPLILNPVVRNTHLLVIRPGIQEQGRTMNVELVRLPSDLGRILSIKGKDIARRTMKLKGELLFYVHRLHETFQRN